MIRTGTVLGGRYELIRRLGIDRASQDSESRTSDAMVFLAWDRLIGTNWAVKMIRSEDENHSVLGGRLRNEAALLKQLQHPGLPRIVDLLEEGGYRICVMDYIEGISMRQWMLQKEYVSQEQLLRWAIEIWDIVSYLHLQNPPIIHCDIKPENLILRKSGSVALLDLGTGRIGRTQKISYGTPGYAAAEQFEFKNGQIHIDARTDQFGFGRTMQALFEYRKERDFNAEIKKILVRCTQKLPSDRYPDDQHVSEALETALHCFQERRSFRTSNTERIRSLKRTKRTASELRRRSIRMLIFSIVCFCIGIFLRGAGRFYEQHLYRQRMMPSRSAGFAEQESSLIAAIQMFPELPEGYEALLKLYVGDGKLTEKESRTFEVLFSNYIGENAKKEASEALLFRIGQTFFCLSEHFREGAVRAEAYFRKIPERAGAYLQICTFISEYIYRNDPTKPPSKAEYIEWMNNIHIILAEMEDEEISGYARLVAGRELIQAIYGERFGLAAAGIGRDELYQWLQENTGILGRIKAADEQGNMIKQETENIRSLLNAWLEGG